MIITKLFGGLGNQMFQYAFGRYLSIKNRCELKFDISWFRNKNAIGTNRKYSLNIFNIDEKFASVKEINKLKYKFNFIPLIKILRLFNKNYNIYKSSYYPEKGSCFNPVIHSLIKKDIYIEGYWQSEKYFMEIQDIIKNDFTIKINPVQNIKKLLNEIKKNNSVSIHIRRGDYITNPVTNKFHGVCSLGYYYEAIKIINKKIKNSVYIIFSDDPGWVKKNFKIKNKSKIIEGNADYDDLRLMQNCKHHITANSSFSWWGAWLAENKNKIIIVPKKWFNDSSKGTGDLLPGSWMKI